MVIKWEAVKSELAEKGVFAPAGPRVFRAKVRGGWFIQVDSSIGVGAFFYPDPEHTWDGSSLP